MGLLAGIGLVFLYRKTRFPLPANVLIFFALSMLMLGIEELLKPYFDISSLLAVVVMGMCVLLKLPKKAEELSNGYNGIWKFFEIRLFVLMCAPPPVSRIRGTHHSRRGGGGLFLYFFERQVWAAHPCRRPPFPIDRRSHLLHRNEDEPEGKSILRVCLPPKGDGPGLHRGNRPFLRPSLR